VRVLTNFAQKGVCGRGTKINLWGKTLAEVTTFPAVESMWPKGLRLGHGGKQEKEGAIYEKKDEPTYAPGKGVSTRGGGGQGALTTLPEGGPSGTEGKTSRKDLEARRSGSGNQKQTLKKGHDKGGGNSDRPYCKASSSHREGGGLKASW